MKSRHHRTFEYWLGVTCILVGLAGFLLRSNSYLGVLIFSTGVGLMRRQTLLEHLTAMVKALKSKD